MLLWNVSNNSLVGKIEQIYDNKKQNNMLSELNDISVRDSTTDRWQYHFTVKLISEIEKDQKLKLHQWYLSVINENNIQYRINSSFINCIISIHFLVPSTEYLFNLLQFIGIFMRANMIDAYLNVCETKISEEKKSSDQQEKTEMI